MQDQTLERLSGYFQQEMTSLAEGGRRFAQAYPELASRLDLHGRGSDDPHVARLLESFAFLTARLQMRVDDQFSQFSSALLGVLYPQFVHPIPSATIVQFAPLPGMAMQLKGAKIPLKTSLTATSEEGYACRFQTTMDVDLWPLEVVDVASLSAQECDVPHDLLRSPHVLRIRVRSLTSDLSQLPFEKLCFYLSGDPLESYKLYEWLFTYDPDLETPVLFQSEGEAPKRLPLHSLKRVGFELDQALLPVAMQTHHAYQLLLDYCAFPQKFLFFEIANFPQQKGGQFFDLLIPLGNGASPKSLFLSADSVRLGCAPAVNLFPKTAEPIRLDHQKLEYRLIGDQAREKTTKIHSVLKVSSAFEPHAHAQIFHPYFSFNHVVGHNQDPCFWLARRGPCVQQDLPGTDLFLSFVDYGLKNQKLPVKTVYAHTLCTNRQLARLVPAGTAAEIQGSITGVEASILDRPTKPITPPMDGDVQWRLISHLAMNHLGICHQTGSIKPLRELLRLYSFIERGAWSGGETALVGLKCAQSMGRMHHHGWSGYVPQLSVELSLDETSPGSQGLFLLGMILDEVFRLSAGFNTLIETTLLNHDKQRVWKRLKPSPARQILL